MNITATKIGIVGGGQLGKMMILEAKRLGSYVITLDPSANCPSASISDELIVASFDNQQAYFDLANKADVITYEFEHVNAAALEQLNKPVYPSVKSLKIIQNKFLQKQALKAAGIPVPLFVSVQSIEHIKQASAALGYPMMLKTTTGGYDGYGNALIRDEASIEAAYKKLGSGTKELMLEEFVPFEKEISIIACRGLDGARVTYPVGENHHENSILDMTIVPARIDGTAHKHASEVAEQVLELFDGVGAFGVEMFVSADGQVLVNEVAPRPHNSGHYTIEGCFANQFENHVRAITGLSLGSTELISPTVMVNLLGESDGEAQLLGAGEAYAQCPKLQLHFYGKPLSKRGRKMGHFTVVDATLEGAIKNAQQARMLVRVVGK